MTGNLRPEHGTEEEAKIADLRASPKKLFCHFHGPDSDYRTNQCLEKKKTLDKMESEKKAKLIGHTTWPQTPHTQPPFVPPPPFTQTYRPSAFNYNYNPNWQPQPNPQT